MNPFEPGGGTIPPAPVDIPIPEIPATDFVAVGKQVSDGLAAGGWTDRLILGLVNATVAIVTKALGAILGLIELAIAKVLTIVFKVFTAAEFGTNALASTVLTGMTGLSVGQETFSNATNRGDRDQLSADLVALLQTALSKGVTKDATGALEPGSSGAEEFLKLVTHMGLEGWWMGFIADTFSFHHFEHLGDIKEVLEESLGLGRLARRALSAPMKVFVEDPYTWKLNAAWRPTKLGVTEYIREYLRGEFDRTTLDQKCSLLGHTAANVTALINTTRVHLSPSDIVTLVLHGKMDGGTASTLLKAQGYDDATATQFLFVRQQSHYDTYDRELIAAAFAALAQHNATKTGVQQVIDNSGLPLQEKTKLSAVLEIRAELAQRTLSLAQGEQLVELNLWNMDQFRALVTRLGYSADDERTLEFLLLLKAKKASDAAHAKQLTADARAAAQAARLAAAQAKLAHAPEIAEAHGVSIAKYELLVTDGLRTIAQYRSFLLGKGLAPDNIDALATLLQAKLDRAGHTTSTVPALAAAAKQRQLDLSQLGKAVLAGHVTKTEYQSRVKALGFSDADVTILVELLDDSIAAQATKGVAKTGASNTLKARGISLGSEERAVRLGLKTIAQYSAFLDSHGFAPEDRDLLVHLMQGQLVTDDQARALRGYVSGQMQARGLSLRELEQSVRAGVSGFAEFQLQLSKAGFDSVAQEALLNLLTLHMEQDQHSFALHGQASALLGEHGLSISEIEAAVKFGTKTLADYAAALKASGLAADDVETLRLTLAAKLKIDPGAAGTGA